MPQFVNDNGTIKETKEMYVNDQGTVKEVMEAWVNDQGTVKQYYKTSRHLQTLVAGAASPNNITGFNNSANSGGPMGSVAPSTVRGQLLDFLYGSGSSRTTVGLGFLSPDLGQYWWTAITITGPNIPATTLLSKNSFYSGTTGWSNWSLGELPNAGGFVNGETYEVEWTFPEE